MCGINGFILNRKTEEKEIRSTLEVMNKKIVHRGPDDDGFFIDTCGKSSVAMAMRRLSIIDLHTGKQPIISEDENYVIVFNGEIYNYVELKNDLTSQGIQFKTASDTEVILKSYIRYGTQAFSKLDGMFVFSIFDKTKNKILIARDFFGEKPLYFLPGKEEFYWASELKSIIAVLPKKPEINTTALQLFLQLTYIPAPYCIYDGIFKLEPNHFIEINTTDLNYEVKKIEDCFQEIPIHKSFDNNKKQIKKLVTNSVVSRKIADVPVGTFLSGGVDSSIVSLCLSKESEEKINTFSIGFENKKFDETERALLVSKQINSKHHQFTISSKYLENDIEKIILNFDEPFADSSALPSFLVAQKTSEFVKVALTGDGGDEVFGGYNKYFIGKINQTYTSIFPQTLHNTALKFTEQITKQNNDKRGIRFKVRKAVGSIQYGEDYYYNIIKLGFSESALHHILNHHHQKNDALHYYKNKLKSPKTLKDYREVDRMMSLEGDLLVKVDRTSMLNSLECRAPFLNKNLWNFVNQLPKDYFIIGNNKKYILKKAFEEDFPKSFLNKTKRGFGVPVGDWMKEVLKEELISYTNPKLLEEQNIFNIHEVNGLVKNHISGVCDNTFRVWTYYCFQKWYFNVYSS